MSEIILPAAADALTASDQNTHLREATRAAMLAETLQLGRYTAFTQAAVVMVLTAIFWDVASHNYLAGLCASVTALCSLVLVALRRYHGRLGEDVIARESFVVLHGLALGRGLAWASMPAVLLPSLDNAYRTVVGAVCAALISHAYVAGPIFSLAVLAVAPVVIGLFVGLAGCEGPVGQYVGILLAIYAAFVFVSARRICRHSYQRIRDRVIVRAQSETIGFLLRDFAEGTSDWLWETDRVGRLRQARAAVAALLGIEAAGLRHRTLSALLQEFADPDGDGADAAAVAAAIEARAPFRDRTIRLRTASGTRWLMLNGKPVFDAQGAFAGYRGGSDATESREAQARIAFLAGHDSLTGLPNRGGFQEMLAELCREVRTSERRSALFYLDLDGFKAVNDSRGHLVGDRLLKEVASRLLAISGPHGGYRLGGDEFAVLVRDVERPKAEALA
jgi:predicted signal transduction protein with EAL and GGDEF domain